MYAFYHIRICSNISRWPAKENCKTTKNIVKLLICLQGLEYILIGKTGLSEELHNEIRGPQSPVDVVDLGSDDSNDGTESEDENGSDGNDGDQVVDNNNAGGDGLNNQGWTCEVNSETGETNCPVNSETGETQCYLEQ